MLMRYGRTPFSRVMAFVDGGYLREQCSKKFNEEINFQELKGHIIGQFNSNTNGNYKGDLIRIYYYDAIVDHENPKFKEQTDYFNRIIAINGYEVRLGDLVPTGKDGKGSLKQKGVDVLLAVDMLSKAYSEQYDFAIIIAGDSDFFEVVNAVKDSGKRVFGMYFRNHIAENLYDVLDARIEMDNLIASLRNPTI